MPKVRNLWYKVEARKTVERRQPGSGPASKIFQLGRREPTYINSALSDEVDVSSVGPLKANTDPQRCFNGQMIGHEAFLITTDDRAAMVQKQPSAAEVTYPYLNGVDALTGATLDRYVIDFEQRDRFAAEHYSEPFGHVRSHVLPDRERKAEEGKDAEGNVRPHHKGFLARWWQLSFGRPEMLGELRSLQRFLACSLVTKRPIFLFVSSKVRPSNLLQIFAFEDDYSFGILQSGLHWKWFITKCSKLKSDFRYGAESVFDTFPWPQSPTAKQARAVANAAVALRTLRREIMTKLGYSLRDLYRTLDDPGANPLRDAHATLDAAVRAAYGMPADADVLGFLLDLNLACAAREKAGEPVTPPGLPSTVAATPEERASYVTDDCVRA